MCEECASGRDSKLTLLEAGYTGQESGTSGVYEPSTSLRNYNPHPCSYCLLNLHQDPTSHVEAVYVLCRSAGPLTRRCIRAAKYLRTRRSPITLPPTCHLINATGPYPHRYLISLGFRLYLASPTCTWNCLFHQDHYNRVVFTRGGADKDFVACSHSAASNFLRKQLHNAQWSNEAMVVKVLATRPLVASHS
jgi:hypothetical protein